MLDLLLIVNDDATTFSQNRKKVDVNDVKGKR